MIIGFQGKKSASLRNKAILEAGLSTKEVNGERQTYLSAEQRTGHETEIDTGEPSVQNTNSNTVESSVSPVFKIPAFKSVCSRRKFPSCLLVCSWGVDY